MQEYDRSSKWLIEHHGRSILRLAGVENVISCRALQAEVVQPRQLPDGLLEVRLADRPDADLFLVEIATYPDRRLLEQVLRDALLVFLDRRVLPEVVALILQPKGLYEVPDSVTHASALGLSRFELGWKTVRLWTLAAEQLLAANEVGLLPWVPLTRIQGPPLPVLRECRERIDRQAPDDEHANLLAVIQVLARLRYNAPELLAIFGGDQAMIESPLIKEITERAEARGEARGEVRGAARAKQDDILLIVAARFKAIPEDMSSRLRAIADLDRLNTLIDRAVQCSDLESFRADLTS